MKPWKVSLIAVIATAVLMGIAIAVFGADQPGRSSFDRGEAAGDAAAPTVLVIAVAAYLIQRSRLKKGNDQ